MPLTRPFKNTVKARTAIDPAFEEALLEEGLNALLEGDPDTCSPREESPRTDDATSEDRVLGKPFYFRARGEQWRVGVGGDPVCAPEWERRRLYDAGEGFAAG